MAQGISQDKKTRLWKIYKRVSIDGVKFIVHRDAKYKTKSEALKALDEIISQKTFEIKSKNTFDKKAKITMNEVFDDYALWYESKNKKSSYLTMINLCKPAVDFFGNQPLVNAISNERMVEFRKNLQATENLCIERKNKVLSKTRELFKRASGLGYIDSNDYNRVCLYLDNFKNDNRKKKEEELKFYSKSEFDAFISTFEKNDKWYFFFNTLYYSGLRCGEIIGLHWTNIDFEKNTLTIDHQCTNKLLTGGMEEVSCKTFSSYRTIHLPSAIINLLQVLKDNSTGKYVFFNDYPASPTTIDRVIKEHANKANIKVINKHGFRHSHASFLFENKFDILYISKRLGHKDIATTLKIYVHMYEESKNINDDKLELSCNNVAF